MNALILQKLLSMFIDKKRIIGWVSAVAIAIAAAAAGMQSEEFKSAVCSAPVINPVTPPAAPAVGK